MPRILSPQNNGKYRLFVSMFFSFLPILSAVFAICFGVGISLIAMLLADNHYTLAAICFLVLAVILTQILGPLAYRFFARAFPLRASGEVHARSLRFLKYALVASIAVCIGLGVWGWDLISFMVAPTGNLIDRVFGKVFASIWLTICAILLLFTVCVNWSLIKVINFHRRPKAWATQGFMLFLRSFGAVSDSAALGLLVRASGVHNRVALLSSPKELMTSWDPMTLAVAGFSFRHPFHSVPVYLESTEDTWVGDVRRLADLAKVVVIDISHRSPGLSRELEILSESGFDAKTVKFEEHAVIEFTEDGPGVSREEVLFVEKSRYRRWISQALGFIFTYLGFLILTALGVSVPDPNWSTKVGTFILWASLLYSVVPGIWVALALSPEAGFTRKSSLALIRAIQRKTNDPSVTQGAF